jgi:hypothetical protein
MKGQTQQTASALLPTQGQQLQPPLPERQLVSQSQTEKVQQLPNPSQQDRMENFQRSGMLKHVIGQEEIFSNSMKMKKPFQTFHQVYAAVVQLCNSAICSGACCSATHSS